MVLKNFNCTSCGACCRIVGLIPEFRERFFTWINNDGACKHLQEDNTCGIYETRPDICRVDVMFEQRHSKNMSEAEYVAMTEDSCAILEKNQDRYPDEYRKMMNVQSE